MHIQWSYADNSVKVINTTLQNQLDLKAEAIIYDLNGQMQTKYGKSVTINAAPDTTTSCFDLNFSTENLAYKKNGVASSGAVEAPDATAVTDGNSGSRWSSNYSDNEWVYVDLGAEQTVKTVILNWEAAYAKAYKIQVSNDAQRWTDVYSTSEGKGVVEQISITPVKARYVKMQGIQRATNFGYSLYDLEVYNNNRPALTDVQFIKLLLTDPQGKPVSDNFYWRSNKLADYTALSKLPKAKLKYESKLTNKEGKAVIEVTVNNPTAAVAFAIRVQAIRTSDGERLLPALMTDNYFTLFKGERKRSGIEFDAALLQGGGYKLIVEPYNK